MEMFTGSPPGGILRLRLRGSTPMKPPAGLSRRDALDQLARKGREIKRRSPSTFGSGVKQPKMVLKEPSSKDSGSNATVSEKAKTPQVMDAGSIPQAPPTRVEGQSPSVAGQKNVTYFTNSLPKTIYWKTCRK
ncbi:hypothetical protein L6452_17538 [Arctium lappa]|uniref:Uncharacterized protein n=1 Tax=Arctium lappa TaxID=4217 RepID=A0ACB9C3R8_ARCLA|nr:hypothetical protein L6452_17538 [Arctium lappa]